MDLKRFKNEILPLRNKLLSYARKLTTDPDDAEDAVQETMLKLWSRRDELDSCRNPEAFAVTVTHNVCMDTWRTRHGNAQSAEQLQLADSADTPYARLEARDRIELVERIINSLPPLQRTIMRMKDMEEYETEEIAQITGCSPEGIRSNLSRARKKVRDTYLRLTEERRTT